MRRKQTRRKCRCCKEFFFPDYRHVDRQKFCMKPACRLAFKTRSQQRWWRKKENRDYFRGEDHVRRVRAWRKDHPGYWRKKKPLSKATQPADFQSVKPEQESCNVPAKAPRTLQDFCLTEHPAFVGLISMVTGSTLQDEIEATGRRLILQGQNILGLKVREVQPSTSTPMSYDPQTPTPPGPAPPSPSELQLG